ncbi:MAG: MFS transporter [Rhodospirillaceae bacterium]|nr:MFS transporter [Rhodospirillaceae bacterium]
MAESTAPARAAPAAAPASDWKAWYAIGVLMVIYTSSFIDRSIISLMVQPIRRDLDITDTQFSLLQGFAFAVFYTLAGLPLGWAADRYSRRILIFFGTTFWSLATAACGLAQSFLHMFLARVGVGIGEATLSPSAQSLITDLFPRDKLARALAIYNLGISFGQGLAFLIGGTVIGLLSSAEAVDVPVLGAMKPWQLTFMAVGLPGVILAMFMFTVREPERKGRLTTLATENRAGAATGLPLMVSLGFFWKHRRAYGWWVAGNSLLGFVLFGFGAWMPTSLIRTFGWTAAEAGQTYGVLLLLFGTSGAVVAAWITDILVKRDTPYAYYKMLAWNCVLLFPFAVAAPLANSPTLAVALLALAVLFANPWVNISGAALLAITPNQMRGQIVAIKFFFSSTVSFTIAPTVIALLTDYVFGRDEGVRYSLAVVSVVCVPCALFCYRMAMKPYEEMQALRHTWAD